MGRWSASYSTSIAAAAAGTPQRGSVHSVFVAAANVVFPTPPPGPTPVYPQGSPLLSDFVLSLNALDSPQMPNGLRLSVPAGTFPFTALRPGMSVLFGAQRLHIEAIEYSLDLSTCPQWDPHIYHPARLDRQVLEKNRERLATIWEEHDAEKGFCRGEGGLDEEGGAFGVAGRNQIIDVSGVSIFHKANGGRPQGSSPLPFTALAPTDTGIGGVDALARSLCGRGVGLTPTGDDILAGWMAVGWLLYGAAPDFLAACQQIDAVAQQQTHLLSRCWLGYAARGDVALPIVSLVEALAGDGENEAQLARAAQAVLAMGATSGYDVMSGILLGLDMYLSS